MKNGLFATIIILRNGTPELISIQLDFILLKFKMQIHCTALFQTLVPLSISDSTFVKFTSISMFRDKQYLQRNKSDKKEKKDKVNKVEKQTRTLFYCFHWQEQHSKLQYR